MHDEIIKYSMDGTLSDSNITQSREEMLNFMKKQMRDEGVTVSIDIDPQFTLDYNPESETYQFSLSVYGVYVGSEEAWDTSGVMNGKKIPNPSRQGK